jgi:anaerobic selenocysteine-containing dehydrogenase
MIRQALNPGEDGFSRNPGMEEISPERLAAEGHIQLSVTRDNGEPFLPFSRGSVPTPTGKIEFYSEALAASGDSDPLPGFVPPAESRFSAAAARFPLEFLPRKADNFMNSTFANLDGHRRMESRTQHILEIHAQDAASRSIADGDLIRIWNDRGSIQLTARISDRIPAGVVAGKLDWAKFSPGGQNVNVLTSERLTDIGHAATFYSTLVEVAKA